MTRKIPLLAAAAVIAVVAVWYMALWKPAGHQLATAQAALVSAQNDRAQASLQHSALVAQAAKLPAEEAKAESLTAAAPAGNDIAGVIDQINAIATATGVSWQSESQTPGSSVRSTPGSGSVATPASALSSFTMTLSVTGTYPQILGFVERLQQMPRLTVVTSLSVAAGGSAPAGGGVPASASGGTALTTQVTATIYDDPSPMPSVPKVKG